MSRTGRGFCEGNRRLFTISWFCWITVVQCLLYRCSAELQWYSVCKGCSHFDPGSLAGTRMGVKVGSFFKSWCQTSLYEAQSVLILLTDPLYKPLLTLFDARSAERDPIFTLLDLIACNSSVDILSSSLCVPLTGLAVCAGRMQVHAGLSCTSSFVFVGPLLWQILTSSLAAIPCIQAIDKTITKLWKWFNTVISSESPPAHFFRSSESAPQYGRKRTCWHSTSSW